MRAQRRFPHDSSWLDDLAEDDGVLDDMARAQRDSELHRALAALPDRARDILRLHFGEDLTHEAISARLGVTRRIVKRDLVSAYANLRLALSGIVDGCTHPQTPVAIAGEKES
jgi:RNA polymerase sigma factor (sigma-70 family)